MSHAHSPKPHFPNHDVPEEFEPDAPPVEPDQGPVPPLVPDDPEHERVTDPGPNQALLAQSPHHHVEVAICP